MKSTKPTSIHKGQGWRKKQLTPEQSARVSTWLRDRRLSYPKIVSRIRRQFGVKVSGAWLSRFFQADTRPGKPVQQTHYVIETTIKLKRNGEVIATRTECLPLSGAANRRHKALLHLAGAFN